MFGTKSLVAVQVGRVRQASIFGAFETQGQVAPDIRRDLAD